MKQLFYFFTGFLISFVFITVAFANIPFNDISPDDLVNPAGYDRSYRYFADRTEAVTVRIADGYNKYTEKGYSWGGYQCGWHTPTTGDTLVFFMWGVDPPPPPDSDGNPDDTDMYPNDPNPYSIKLVGYQTIDGSFDGEHVREVYVTDRGDYFSIGADYDDTKDGNLVNSGTWIDPMDLADNRNTNDTQVDLSGEGTAQQPGYTTKVPTGEAPKDSDPDLKSGTESTGQETDNEALRGTMDNTGRIADNTKRNGEYLKSLNAAIQNMDRNISFNNSNSPQDELKKKQDENETQQGLSDMNNINVSDSYNSTNFSGNLEEGTDYEPAKDLADESWFTGFFTNNPLKTAFDNSGFSMTNETCTMTLVIDHLGTHTLSLCEFDQEFQKAGVLLLGLTGLMSLIIIAWR